MSNGKTQENEFSDNGNDSSQDIDNAKPISPKKLKNDKQNSTNPEKKKETIFVMIIKFCLPFVFALFFSLFLYSLFPELLSDFGSLFVFYFFTPAGMEVGILYGIEGTDLNTFQIVGFMLIIDLLTAIFLIWNFDYTKAIPGIKRLVIWIEKKA